jgi:putative glutathione S-transferase
MGRFVDGEWKTGWYQSGGDGSFQRPPTTFREQIEQLEDDRYHLYVSWACPWAHRTLIARSVLGLASKISVSYVDWFLDDDGWRFFPEHDGSTEDHLYGFDRLRHLYKKADDKFTGRVTVPVLWDGKNDRIVNNESREVLRLFSTRLRPWHAESAPDLCPEELQGAIDETLDAIYEPINNGVYNAGFASSQEAYDRAVTILFEALDGWETHLDGTNFLVGERFTEADICLFTTLLRFDPVYHTHFKCSLRMIAEYPNLDRYLKRIYHQPGVAETCRLDHITHHYYVSHRHINPTGVVAKTPRAFSLG